MVVTEIPSPKTNRSSSEGWYRFYAMFSEDFARGTIRRANLPAGSVVADPWLGTGTSTSSAVDAGHRAVGFDINPVMIELSRGRLLTQTAGRASVDKLLASVKRFTKPLGADDPLLNWFGPNTSAALRRWERAITAFFPEAVSPYEAGFLRTCLFEVACNVGRVYRTKNPTWPRRPKQEKAEVSEKRVDQLASEAFETKLPLCKMLDSPSQATIELGSAKATNLADASVDLVLTSPPYCTRIDYAVTTAIELAVLGIDLPSVTALRDSSMGTSTIRGTAISPSPLWGKRCNRLLDRIDQHPSKSSHSYYLKTFLQYFDDLFRSLAEVKRCLKPGGKMVIVVQDSVYKGIQIDVARIVIEMCTSLGMLLQEVIEFEAVRNMRRVNTRSRSYLKDVHATESVLWIQRPV